MRWWLVMAMALGCAGANKDDTTGDTDLTVETDPSEDSDTVELDRDGPEVVWINGTVGAWRLDLVTGRSVDFINVGIVSSDGTHYAAPDTPNGGSPTWTIFDVEASQVGAFDDDVIVMTDEHAIHLGGGGGWFRSGLDGSGQTVWTPPTGLTPQHRIVQRGEHIAWCSEGTARVWDVGADVPAEILAADVELCPLQVVFTGAGGTVWSDGVQHWIFDAAGVEIASGPLPSVPGFTLGRLLGPGPGASAYLLDSQDRTWLLRASGALEVLSTAEDNDLWPASSLTDPTGAWVVGVFVFGRIGVGWLPLEGGDLMFSEDPAILGPDKQLVWVGDLP